MNRRERGLQLPLITPLPTPYNARPTIPITPIEYEYFISHPEMKNTLGLPLLATHSCADIPFVQPFGVHVPSHLWPH